MTAPAFQSSPSEVVGPYPGVRNVRYSATQARANGILNDTQSIRSILGEIATAVDGAQKVRYYFPRGTYILTGGLTLLTGNSVVEGDGDETVFSCAFSGGSAQDAVWLAQTLNDVSFRDFKVQGTHATGVDMFNGLRCRIRRVNISGGTLVNTHGVCAGIYTQSMDDLEIDRCILSGNGSAAGEGHADIVNNQGTYQITNSKITNNRCLSTLVNANIICFDPLNVTIRHNECAGAIVSPISNTRQGYGILLYHTATGPTAEQVRKCKVLDNTVHNVQGCAIFCQDVSDTIVKGNTCYEFGSAQSDASLPVAGVACEGSGYVIVGNRIRNKDAAGTVIVGTIDGIAVSANSDSVVAGNTITGIYQNGIGIRGVCTNVSITGNTLKEVRRVGIGMWSDTAATFITVSGNTVRTLLSAGATIGIFPTAACADWTVIGNSVSDIGTNIGYAFAGSRMVMELNREEGRLIKEGWGNNIGDANYVIQISDRITQSAASALTANRTWTLPLETTLRNARFRIVRSGLGAFTLTLQDSALNVIKVLPAGAAAFVVAEVNDATGAWRLAEYGLL